MISTLFHRRPILKPLHFAALLLALALPGLSSAQQFTPQEGDPNEQAIYNDYKESKTRDLNWLNEQFLAKQRTRIDDITRENFGRTLSSDTSNLELIQRIIDEGLIEKEETLELQALGVILGDAYVDRERSLVWQVYMDELGQSHAVCVKNSDHCLFPLTMLSRRMEVGIKPDIDRIYDKGLQAVKGHMPRMPFSRSH